MLGGGVEGLCGGGEVGGEEVLGLGASRLE